MNRGFDFGERGGLEGQIDDRDGGDGDAEGHAGEFAFDLGDDEGNGFGSAGGTGDDVLGGGTATFPILLTGAVNRFLGGGVSVDGGHQAFGQSETLFEQDVDDGGEAVGGNP